MKLYKWQEEAYKELTAQDFKGVVKVASGKGKTVLALRVIEKIIGNQKGSKALVVVPTIALLHQWKKEVNKFCPQLSTSFYFGERKDESGDVVLAVINSAAKLELKEEYKIKILDEIHHCGAALYQSIFSIPTHHTIGLSATPEREDDGDLAIRYGAGKIVYSLDMVEELLLRFSMINIRVHFTAEEYAEYMQAYNEYRKLLFFAGFEARDVERYAKRGNKYALRILKLWSQMSYLRHTAKEKIAVIKEIVNKEKNEKMIIFSESIEFSETLADELDAIVVHSNLRKKEVIKRLNLFRDKEKGVLVAPRMIDEGYDVPDANVSLIASFTRKGRQMIQRDGRLLRKSHAVRRYTLVIRDVEEEKFFKIIQDTNMTTIAMQGTWLIYEQGLHKDKEFFTAFEEYLGHEDGYEKWLKQKLDFFVMTRQMDYAFYKRHKIAIKRLLEEDPKRWKLLLEQETPSKIQFESPYPYDKQANIKEQVREVNTKLFLPEELFLALMRFIEGEAFTLECDDRELAIRLAQEADPKMWPKEIRILLKKFAKKLESIQSSSS